MVRSSRAKIANAIEVIGYALDELPEIEALSSVAEVLRRLIVRQQTLVARLEERSSGENRDRP